MMKRSVALGGRRGEVASFNRKARVKISGDFFNLLVIANRC